MSNKNWEKIAWAFLTSAITVVLLIIILGGFICYLYTAVIKPKLEELKTAKKTVEAMSNAAQNLTGGAIGNSKQEELKKKAKELMEQLTKNAKQ